MICATWIPWENRCYQCQAIRLCGYANDIKSTNMRCTLTASCEVEGVRLCRRHGGKAVLILLAGPEKDCPIKMRKPKKLEISS